MMRFSLVGTTRGLTRRAELIRLLQSLARQSVPVQFILVWQNAMAPDVELALLLSAVKAVIVPAPLCSLSHARNLGLERVDGDTLGFPDDDCWYPPSLLQAVERTFAEQAADSVCIGVLDPLVNRRLGKRPRDVVRRVTFRNCLKLPVSVGLFVRITTNDAQRYRFDESLGAGCPWGSGEESDLVARLLKSGARVIYDGRIAVYHAVSVRGSFPSAAKALSYGLGFGIVTARLLRHRAISHLEFYAEMLGRSAAGAALAAIRGDSMSARYYLARLRGMAAGLLIGIRGSNETGTHILPRITA